MGAVACALLAALLCAAIVKLPRPATIDFDPSWRAVLGYLSAQGLQFGRDVVFTYGPLGFLMTRTYDGLHLRSLIAWQLLVAPLFAVLILRSAGRLAPLASLVYVAFFLVLATVYDEALYLIAIALLGAELLRATRAVSTSLLCALLALLGILQFTHMILAVVALAIACCLALGEGRVCRAALMAGSFAASLVGIWFVCGQRLGTLRRYFSTSLALSFGYPDAMSLSPPAAPLWKALAVLVLLAATLALAVAASRGRARAAAGALLVAAYVFLTWRLGFVRADGHMIFFFVCALVPILGLPALLLGDPPRWRAMREGLLAAAAVLCLAGIDDVHPLLVRHGVELLAHRLSVALDTATAFDRFHRDLDERWEVEAREFDLPRTRALVGDAPLDVLALSPVVALYNGFHYEPRPLFVSDADYLPSLERLGARFFASPQAPEFVVQRLGSVDNRLPTLDDSLALRELVERYRWVESEKGFALWRRASDPPVEIPPRRVAVESIDFGRPFALGGLADHDVWAKLSWRLSWSGELRALLYQPPVVYLRVQTADGATHTYRLPRGQARTGFLLNPLIESDADLKHYARGAPVPRVTTVTLAIHRRHAPLFDGPAKLELFRLPDRSAIRLSPGRPLV
jgi:hypothetical protein